MNRRWLFALGCLGLFATGAFGVPTPDGVDTSTTVKGFLFGGGLDQLKAQFIGSLTCVVVISLVSIASYPRL